MAAWATAGGDGRVELTRDEIVRPETDVLRTVGSSDDIRLLGLCELGDCPNRRELHLLIDGASAHVEGAAEDEGEAENVI